MALTFIAAATASNQTDTGGSITIPATAQEDDIAVMVTRKRANGVAPGGEILAGWTRFQTAATNPVRVQAFYRTITASGTGSPGSSFDPWEDNPGNVENQAIMFVFRPDAPSSSITAFGVNAELTSGNPASQSVNASAQTAPLLVIGAYAGQNPVSPRTFSPSEDGEATAHEVHFYYAKRKIYNSSPADTTIDMNDEGNFNGLHSFGLEIVEELPVIVTVGLVTQTHTALSVGVSKSVTAGLASETDTAFSVSGSKVRSVGLAQETGTALPATADRAYAMGLAQETDSALSATPNRTYPVGLASETDSALAVTGAKNLGVGLASETDTAFPVTVVASQIITVGLAQETDTAFPINISKTMPVGLAVETDTANPVQAKFFQDPTWYVARGPTDRRVPLDVHIFDEEI